MHDEPFTHPQRQSKIGVVLIFFTSLYKFLRGFWAVGAYLIVTNPSEKSWFYIVLGLAVLGILMILYSYAYYRKFQFHIDYEKEAFVLQKGVFSSELVEIPFDKIQQVNVEQSLLQRLANVHKLVVDTAGAKEKEVSIQAISKTEANRLSEILLEAKETFETDTAVEAETLPHRKERVVWSYKMDFLTLLKIGISTNYLRGLVLIIAFFSSIYQELSRWFQDSEALDSYLTGLPDPSNSLYGLVLAAIVMLLGSMLITVIEVFVKYFNLKLQRTENNLQLQMGLKTTKKVSLQPRRVQLLQIKTSPVQKCLDLHEMRISLANSEDSFDKSKIKIPGLGKILVSKVTEFLYSEETGDFQEHFRPHIVLFFRKLLLSVFPVLIVSYILVLFLEVPFQWFFLLSALFLMGMVVFQFLVFKSLQLYISEEFIIKKHGFWSKVENRLETFKIQAITIKKPYFYQKRDLVNVVFHTAGGDLSFSAVHKRILPYINFALYKVESSDKNWM
ncbi:MAG TPA: PH domain-containing protein [Flavobacteriaceae bacterium]|nr:PH domain-containing protein [Flavobacteriaceae bacterium]